MPDPLFLTKPLLMEMLTALSAVSVPVVLTIGNVILCGAIFGLFAGYLLRRSIFCTSIFWLGAAISAMLVWVSLEYVALPVSLVALPALMALVLPFAIYIASDAAATVATREREYAAACTVPHGAEGAMFRLLLESYRTRLVRSAFFRPRNMANRTFGRRPIASLVRMLRHPRSGDGVQGLVIAALLVSPLINVTNVGVLHTLVAPGAGVVCLWLSVRSRLALIQRWQSRRRGRAWRDAGQQYLVTRHPFERFLDPKVGNAIDVAKQHRGGKTPPVATTTSN